MIYVDATNAQLTDVQVKNLFPNVAWDFRLVPPADLLVALNLSLYTPPPESLSSIQNGMWELIKAERDRRIIGVGVPVSVLNPDGVTSTTKGFNTDVVSRTQYQRMSIKADKLTADGSPDSTHVQIAGQDVPWKTMDNTFVIMTIKIINDLLFNLEVQEALVFKQAEIHKAMMIASSDPANYDYSTGWPPVYSAT